MYRPVQRPYCSPVAPVKVERPRLTPHRGADTVRAVAERDDTTRAATTIDLRGIACPLAWAKAKVRLEAFGRGTEVHLLIDDPRSLRDLPRAAESNGHHVIEVDPEPLGPPWRVRLEV
jgi:TusA-related sulfurtransferase